MPVTAACGPPFLRGRCNEVAVESSLGRSRFESDSRNAYLPALCGERRESMIIELEADGHYAAGWTGIPPAQRCPAVLPCARSNSAPGSGHSTRPSLSYIRTTSSAIRSDAVKSGPASLCNGNTIQNRS